MSHTIQLPAVSEFMTRHLVDVFETMLSMKAVRAPGAALPHFDGRVTGSVGFAGEHVTGAVYLHLSAPFASQVAAAMLGITPEEISAENEVNDVVGEATNMITGGLKSWLCDQGADCADDQTLPADRMRLQTPVHLDDMRQQSALDAAL